MKSQRRREQLWLHEATQRCLVRWFVVLLGVLPLIATISFVAVSKTSWYQLREAANWRERIRNNLGLDIVFDSIEMPSPSRFRIRQLVVAHPETQTPILFSELVEGEMTNGGWMVKLHSAAMKQSQSDLALQILHDSFLCRPHNSVPLLKLSIDEVQILPDTKPTKVALERSRGIESAHRVQIEYSRSLVQSEIKIQFGLPESAGKSPAIVHVVRNHEALPPRTEWAVDTRSVSIPCSPFSPYFPAVASLGGMASFRGQLNWTQDSLVGWECKISNGIFEQSAWDNLTTSLGTPLRGTGNLHIADAIIRNGNIEHIAGTLKSDGSRDSEVSLDWLIQSSHSFDWAAEDVSTLKGPLVALDDLNLGFHLTPAGIRWQGKGAIIPGGTGPTYNVFATVENLRFATKSEAESPTIPIFKVGDWLAESQMRTPSKEIVTQWHSKLATMLPPPPASARLSGLPSHQR